MQTLLQRFALLSAACSVGASPLNWPTTATIEEVRAAYHEGDSQHNLTRQVLAPRLFARTRAVAACKRRGDCASRDIYQFGVFTGYSMRAITGYLAEQNVPFRRIIGFDSFVGLPDEHLSGGSSDYRQRVASGDYKAGLYSSSRFYSGKGDAVLRGLEQVVGLPRCSSSEDGSQPTTPCVKWVKGFYNESLTNRIAKSMAPALYVDADADLYSSTQQSLSWMLDHGLIQQDTVIYYDDWSPGHRHKGSLSGQQWAHAHLAHQYRVKLTTLDPGDHASRKGGFVVESVGGRNSSIPRSLVGHDLDAWFAHEGLSARELLARAWTAAKGHGR